MALKTYSCPECGAVLGRKARSELVPDLIRCFAPGCRGTAGVLGEDRPKGQFGETWIWMPGRRAWTNTSHPGVKVLAS